MGQAIESEQVDLEQGTTPGQMLRLAREARGMTQNEVAKALRLSTQRIIDIEKDDYTHVVALIYIRGHLRSYARLLEISWQKVLDAFDQLGWQEQRTYGQGTVTATMGREAQFRRRKRWLFFWIGLGISLLFVGLVVLWWTGQSDQGNLNHPLTSAVVQKNSVKNSAAVKSTPAPHWSAVSVPLHVVQASAQPATAASK